MIDNSYEHKPKISDHFRKIPDDSRTFSYLKVVRMLPINFRTLPKPFEDSRERSDSLTPYSLHNGMSKNHQRTQFILDNSELLFASASNRVLVRPVVGFGLVGFA